MNMNKNRKSGYSVLSQEMAKLEKTKKQLNSPVKKPNSSKEKVKGKGSNSEKVSKSGVKEDKDPNHPDRSYGDFYCKICDSHMNSEDMWNSHVNGKKHLKNVKKGDTDSKYDELNIESDIKYEMKNVKDPIIGLKYIHEIRRKEPNVPPFFSCFLCHATLATIPLVIEHVTQMKHRLNYIKENAPTEYELLQGTNLKKDHLEPLVYETAIKLEIKDGRGEVLVKQEKPKKPYTKRGYFSSDDEDDSYRKPIKNLKNNTTEQPHFWKSVDPPGKVLDDRKERKRHDHKDYYSDDEFSTKYYSKRSFSRDKRDISPAQNTSKSYKRRSEADDYPKRSEYVDDNYHLRHRDLDNNKRSSSPKYESKNLHAREVRKAYSPPRSQPMQYYPLPSSFLPESSLLPHEQTNESTGGTKNFTDASSFKDFLEKVIELPAEIFLKIFHFRLDNMEIKSTDELSTLSKIIAKANALLEENLPRELQNLIKLKFQDPAASSSIDPVASGPSVPTLTPSSPVTPNIEYKSPPKSLDHQSDISFIKAILSSVKSGNPSVSPTVGQNLPTHQYVNSTPVNQAVSNQQYSNSYQSSQQNLHVTAPYNYANSSTVNQNSSAQQFANAFQNTQQSSRANSSAVNQNLSAQQFSNAFQNTLQSSRANSSNVNQNLAAQQFADAFENTRQSSCANLLSNSYSSGPAQQSTTPGNYSYNSQSNLPPAIPGLSLSGNENPAPNQQYNSYQTAPPPTMKNFTYRYM